MRPPLNAPCYPHLSSTPPPPPPLQDAWTPLHVAAACGRKHIIALLLATPEVDPTLRTRVSAQRRLRASQPVPRPPLPLRPTGTLWQHGHTPLELALNNEKAAAVALLRADPRVA